MKGRMKKGWKKSYNDEFKDSRKGGMYKWKEGRRKDEKIEKRLI